MENGWKAILEKPYAKRLYAILRLCFPYALLFVASFAPFMVYFTGSGINNGHDWIWHVAYSGDLLAGYEQGIFTLSPNHYFFGSLGYHTFLFYAYLPEVMVAFFTYMFRGLGATIPMGMKAVAISTLFLSGVWSYRLAKKMGLSEGAALGFGLCYIFFPYRIFNFLARAAFAEGVALAYPPLLFLGLYQILHDKKNRALPYIETVLGVVLLVLSHPFTALTVCLAAIVYLLASFRFFPKVFKQKSNYFYIPLSILAIFCLISFYFFPMEEAVRSGLFRISDEKAVWTDLESVLTHQDDQFFKSGLLNFQWLKRIKHDLSTDSPLLWTLELCFFPLFILLSAFLRVYAEKRKPRLLWLGLGFLPLVLLFAVTRREEGYWAIALLLLGYLASCLFHKNQGESWSRDESELMGEYFALLKKPEFFALCAILVLSFLFMFNPDIWKIAPSSFRKCQFPFRFWGVIGFVMLFIALYLLRPLSKKKGVSFALLGLGCFALMICNAPIDKRINAQNGEGHGEELSAQQMQSLGKIGVMNEYIPNAFYTEDYEPYNSKSLYKAVRNEILYTNRYGNTIEGYKIAFLEGKGKYEVTKLDSPSVSFDLTLTEDSFLQLEQFYYPGYQLAAKNEKGETLYSKLIHTDGLLSFRLPEGTYECELTYVGPLSYRVGLSLLPIGAGILLSFLLYDFHKREEERLLRPLTR